MWRSVAAAPASAPRAARRLAQVRYAKAEPESLKNLRTTIEDRRNKASKGLVAIGNEWFGVGDVNKSKEMDYEEFRNVLKRMAFEVTDNEADSLFQWFDKDNSGEVSYDEFMKGIRGELPAFSSSMKLPGATGVSAMQNIRQKLPQFDMQETEEWAESLQATLEQYGPMRARMLLHEVMKEAQRLEIGIRQPVQTPFLNSIPSSAEVPYPGDLKTEKRICDIMRWNAATMVGDAQRRSAGIGGHIGTFASIADVYLVLQNHILRGKSYAGGMGDQLYVQGHSSPGPYAYAFLEGRLSIDHLMHFRREHKPGVGLSSYPHPRLMPDFWENPTVSLGLGLSQAVYQARFFRYLHLRGLADTSKSRVFTIVGDGEMDESESISSVAVAGRERLNNLVLMINCNYLRLDGPVRGNSKVIQEFEGMLRGAGFDVIKCIYGGEMNKIVEADHDGKLLEVMEEAFDGDEARRGAKMDGALIRNELFKGELAQRVAHLDDAALLDAYMTTGGHDIEKVYNALHQAEKNCEEGGRPTAILFRTHKGHSLKSFVGRNNVHNMKEITMEAFKEFRDELNIPLTDAQLADPDKQSFVAPSAVGDLATYVQERRKALGGPIPERIAASTATLIDLPGESLYSKFYGAIDKPASTTMAYSQILTALMQVQGFGARIVPIATDEHRTFGMESMFPKFKIHAPFGQRYTPVDADQLLSYKEAPDGQMVQEGISEGGAMSTWIAAGTSYSSQGCPMLPFFIYYSMFGFQRVGDFIWQAADARARGFLIGATSGRTTLNGEGLQHQDGHSLLIAYTNPACRGWDPAFVYELSVCMEWGIQEMWGEEKDVIHYICVGNENVTHAAMPPGVKELIPKGLYKFADAPYGQGWFKSGPAHKVRVVGSGVCGMRSAMKAAEILAAEYDVAAELWSAPSFGELYREAEAKSRAQRLNPGKDVGTPYVTQCLGDGAVDVTVAVSDHQKAWPQLISSYVTGDYCVLGTDGFGRSDDRVSLRRFFETDAENVVVAVLSSLARLGKINASVAQGAIDKYGLETGDRYDICDSDTWKGFRTA